MSRTLNSILAVSAVLLSGVASAVQAATLVVYGASGAIGGVIVNEALSRGHTVIGVSRDPARLNIADKHFKAVAGDVTDPASFKQLTQGADAVIISVSGNGKDNLPENSTVAQAARVAVQTFTGQNKAPQVIQIGGAITMTEDRAAMEAKLPPMAKPGSPIYGRFMGQRLALDTYRASTIRWTVLTPPMDIHGWNMGKAPVPKRTGKYRTSTEAPVLDANGKNAIDIADLAVAAVDEAEQHRFVGKRFTVGY